MVADVSRAERIIDGTAGVLRNRSEQELAGYRLSLDYLFQEDWHPLNIGLLLHLHRLLWSETAYPGGELSDQTIRLVLEELKAEQKVSPEGTGRGAVWRRFPDEN
ncbi:hypothetical protein [Kribbella sp.]|uniref:hypothetical protein n=1 Tax=Kribbella sp. TaxID=1871183 RepID=UPI002D4B6EB8|nr:hypothetical protein [Kribbella sp.]HZX07073.1 hypothetical protein [Kribbella sp.]